jgi:hypothetical protein
MKYKTRKDGEKDQEDQKNDDNDSILSDDSEKNDELFSIKDVSNFH